MVLTKKQRKFIFDKSAGRCWYCGCQLPENSWHVDHVNAVWRYEGKLSKPQNDTLENMVPACVPCNLFKGVLSVEVFRMEIFQQVNRARKTSVNFRTAERFGMIQTSNNPINFWFEKEHL